MKKDDHELQTALSRYQVISAYLAMEPKHGQRRKLLEQLSSRSWPGPDGEAFRPAPDTIRVWIYRYKRSGLEGLMDKPRPRRGFQCLSDDVIELICRLKQEVPQRSLDRIITIAEKMQLVERGLLKRSTVHRVLESRGLSARKTRLL